MILYLCRIPPPNTANILSVTHITNYSSHYVSCRRQNSTHPLGLIESIHLSLQVCIGLNFGTPTQSSMNCCPVNTPLLWKKSYSDIQIALECLLRGGVTHVFGWKTRLVAEINMVYVLEKHVDILFRGNEKLNGGTIKGGKHVEILFQYFGNYLW